MTGEADGRVASTAASLWLVIHHHEHPELANGVDDKIIGYFESLQDALRAKNAASILPGFQDTADGFEIIEVALDTILPAPGIRVQY